MGPMAAGCGLPLLFCLLQPGIAVSMLLFALCGACASYLVTTGAVYSRLVPDVSRGQMLGLYTSGLLASQGIAIALAGAVAAAVGASNAIVLAGLLCIALGGVSTAAWQRAARPQSVAVEQPA